MLNKVKRGHAELQEIDTGKIFLMYLTLYFRLDLQGSSLSKYPEELCYKNENKASCSYHKYNV